MNDEYSLFFFFYHLFVNYIRIIYDLYIIYAFLVDDHIAATVVKVLPTFMGIFALSRRLSQ